MKEHFTCGACGYASPAPAAGCENPACLDNPALSEAHRERLRAQAEEHDARRRQDAARMESRRRLRAAGFTPAL